MKILKKISALVLASALTVSCIINVSATNTGVISKKFSFKSGNAKANTASVYIDSETTELTYGVVNKTGKGFVEVRLYAGNEGVASLYTKSSQLVKVDIDTLNYLKWKKVHVVVYNSDKQASKGKVEFYATN